MLFWGFVALATLLGVWNLSSQSMWIDEIASFEIAKKSIPDLLPFLWNEEANMWLYYLLLHFWMRVSQTDFWVRTLSVVFGVLALWPIQKIAEKIWSKGIANTTVFLTIINLFFVFNMQNARSYTLLLLLTSWSSWEFVKIVNSKGKVSTWKYALLTILGIYSHLYAGLLWATQLAMALATRKLSKLVGPSIFIAVCVLPIFLSGAGRGGQVDWLKPPSVVSLLGTWVILAGDFWPIGIIYGMLVLWGLVNIKKKEWSPDKTYIALWLGMPIAFAFGFSTFIRPIYQSVYFLMCVPPLLMLVAQGLDRVKRKNVFLVTLGVITVLSAIRLWGWYTQNQNVKVAIDNKKEEWREAEKYVVDRSGTGDAVIFYGYFGHFSFEHYLFGARWPEFVEITSGKYLIAGGKLLPEPDFGKIADLKNKYSRVWVIISHESDFADQTTQKEMIEQTLSKNFQRGEEVEFEKIRVVLFSQR